MKSGRFLMKSQFSCLALALAGICSMLAFPAGAQTVDLHLAQANNCLSCHRVDRKVVGPGFAAIAERFAGNPGAVDYLAQSILMGSQGRWGPVPMPRQTHVSKADARTLAKWILSLDGSDPKLDEARPIPGEPEQVIEPAGG